MLDKTTSTKIQWKDNCNPTIKKQKKKKGGKKVNVEVKVDSFFNFFNDIDPALEDEKKNQPNADKPKNDDEDDMDDDGIENRLADDLDQADQFKDDLVPLALEYYLGVIEIDAEDDDDDDDDNDDDDDADKKKKKKGGKKGG